MPMWKIVRRRDAVDEEPYWYMEADDERAARIDLARAMKCKVDDLLTVGKQPEPKPTKKRKG